MVLHSPNGLSASVSPETASIALCLIALSSLSFEIQDAIILQRVVTCFYALRELALQHLERQTILGLID